MKKYLAAPLAAAIVAAMLLSGCVTGEGDSGRVYSKSQIKTGNRVQLATVVSVAEVIVEGTSGLGAVGGGVLGGLAGRTIGGGRGRDVATGVGAIGGVLLGEAIESQMARHKALEITVRYENGSLEAIVQDAGSDMFYADQKVRVLTNSDGTKRVRAY